MTVRRVKDNSEIKKDSFKEISKLVNKIADKNLEQLEHEGIFILPESVGNAGGITKEQMILQSTNDSYHTGNIMGFFGFGDECLVIESRFDNESNDYFTKYLLARVLNLPNLVDMKAEAAQEQKMFNFFLFLFPHYLKAAMRKGLFKTYICHEYNDKNVKGSIDVARHVVRNTPFIGNIAYSNREFSYDNDVMELIRHTIEFIRRKPYGNRLLAKAKEDVKLVIDVTSKFEPCDRKRIIEINKKSPIRHAYFREYFVLQRLCLLILEHREHQIGTGMRQIYGIIFDGAWLWEEYINTLIENTFYHPMNKEGKGSQWLFAGNVGLIYPDFISKNSRIVADAKYKPVDNIGNKDYLQMLAYMFRFDAKSGYYIYPEVGNSEDLCLCLNRGSTYENNVACREDVNVIKRGLKIPSGAENYEAFLAMMHRSEQEFVVRLRE